MSYSPFDPDDNINTDSSFEAYIQLECSYRNSTLALHLAKDFTFDINTVGYPALVMTITTGLLIFV